MTAKVIVTAILPDTFAPNGKNGIIPIILFNKIKNKTLKTTGIDKNLDQFNSEFGFGLDSIFIKDPISGKINVVTSPNLGYNTTRNWIRIRLVEELFLSKKNIISSKVIGAIFYFTYDARPEYIQYYSVFYIKFNESKDRNFDITKYK